MNAQTTPATALTYTDAEREASFDREYGPKRGKYVRGWVTWVAATPEGITRTLPFV